MSKKEILHKIKHRDFPKEFMPFFDLLEKNETRVEFVKEGVGLQDVLFLSELQAREFADEPFFACFNVPVIAENEEHNFISMKKSKTTSIADTLHALDYFFSQTTRTLYVWIGFKESSLEQKDMFLIYERIQTNKDTLIYEAKAKVRKFPEWFEAKLPSEIMEEKKYLHILSQIQDEMNEKLQKDIMNRIHAATFANNEDEFIKLGKIYQNMHEKDLLL